ncbi:polysaccharide deacetylase family protein [Pseudomonas knackmussii]|uniref:polysaccharide deacetylase family protein n=1 Tax=Pseudomonas knackmussii TaxID=65741 RepID=UPI003BC0B64C
MKLQRRFTRLMCSLALLLPLVAQARQLPILVYHRFAPQAVDSMTVRTEAFEAQLGLIEAGGYRVIPLRQVVDYLAGRSPAPPPRSLVITVDDGHESVFRVMYPIIQRRRIPVTLFIYPSAISNASYAMTWAQLAELRDSQLFDIQSHTYWHPNFMRERRRLDPAAYAHLVDDQLTRSRAVLEKRLGRPVDLLAWPFGLWDAELEQHAAAAGYVAAFTLDHRPVRQGDDLMALPRYLITDAVNAKAFAAILHRADDGTEEGRR